MISQTLKDQLKTEEHFSALVYLCPAGKRTIGYGRNIDANPLFKGVKIKQPVSKKQAEDILLEDLEATLAQLKTAWPYIYGFRGARLDALVNLSYQIGVRRFLEFRKFHLAALQGNWNTAYKELLNSAWASQTPARAKRVAGQFKTNEYYQV